MWLDSRVTASCDLQLPAYSNPTFQGSGRDASATDQWGHWHPSCQIHSMSISRLFCHQACTSLPLVNHSELRAELFTREAVMLHKFTLIFLAYMSSLGLKLLLSFFFYHLKALHKLRTPPYELHAQKNARRELFMEAHSHSSPKWEFHQTNTIRPLLNFSFMILKGNANEIR